jgi:hypothetical protein
VLRKPCKNCDRQKLKPDWLRHGSAP